MAKLIGIYIEITEKCNASCSYCYNRALVPGHRELPRSVIRGILQDCGAAGVHAAALSGGEPFLHTEIGGILADSAALAVELTVISNGTCFLPVYRPLLLEYHPMLQITFDGWDAPSHDATRGVGNFQQITEGILSLQEAGFSGGILIRLNLHCGNLPNLSKMLRMLDNLYSGAAPYMREIRLAPLHRTEDGGGSFFGYLEPHALMESESVAELCQAWNQTHLAKIVYDHETDLGCAYLADHQSLNCGFRVAPDGRVYPCQLFTDPQYALGNVQVQALSEILEGDALLHFQEMIQARSRELLPCRDCGYQGLCRGGCPANALIENGDILTVGGNCSLRKREMGGVLQRMLREQRERRGST